MGIDHLLRSPEHLGPAVIEPHHPIGHLCTFMRSLRVTGPRPQVSGKARPETWRQLFQHSLDAGMGQIP